MINRILDFSEAPARLRVRLAQLIVERQNLPEVSVPLADLAVVLAAHPQVTFSQAVLSGLAVAGGVFVTCDRRNLPVGMLLPLAVHTTQTERFAAQARAPLPMRKRLWQQIVRAKIHCTGRSVGRVARERFWTCRIGPASPLGRSEQRGSAAARRYWPHLFADLDFRRHRENEDQNILLNYGYAVLRAIVARAICAAGLHPSLGIHHHNRYDAFCLADDLMEPYRPVVDRAVAEYMSTHDEPYQLEAAAKQKIIGDLTSRYDVNGQQRTLFDAAARMASSLADIFMGNADELELPEW